MTDQYFGTKELYEVVLRAKSRMQFGFRQVEAEEPVLYFENIKISSLNEHNKMIMARGGWTNAPRVIWEDRSEIQFTISEGVMSQIGMAILLDAQVTTNEAKKLYVPIKEGPFELTSLNFNGQEERGFYISHQPILYPTRKLFVFSYDRSVIQKKLYCKIIERPDPFDINLIQYFLSIYEDQELTIPADLSKQYVVDYYYEYEDKALIYNVARERFNGLFSLEGKFYSKDENEGMNYTNLLYMPKVSILSDINIRLGERADPMVSTFNIIGIPEENTILEIARLNSDIE